jgi:hypothetical protein
VPEAVLRLEHARGRIDLTQPLAKGFDRAIRIRAEELAPGADVGASECRIDAEHAVVAVRVVGQTVLDVPVPHARGS